MPELFILPDEYCIFKPNSEQHLFQQIFSFAQSKANEFTQKELEKYTQHAEQYQNILNAMSDDVSKQQYMQGLYRSMIDFKPYAEDPSSNLNLKLSLIQSLGLPTFYFTEPPQATCKESLLYMLDVLQSQQYQYPEFVTIEENDICLDCDAKEGVFSLWAIKQKAKAYAFESKPLGFKALCSNVENFSQTTNTPINIQECCHCLQFSNTSQKEFYVPKFLFNFINENESQEHIIARFSTDPKFSSQTFYRFTTTIDEWCKVFNVKPTFIKIDLGEGKELAALQGAVKTLTNNKPKLAIRLSNCPDHLLQIPEFLLQTVPEYNLFCSQKNKRGDLMLYATVTKD